MRRHVRYLAISIGVLLFQIATSQLLSLEGIVPDFLAIWIVYLALREGQLPATVWGFVIGLLLDILTGNFLGLSALTKTVCGFVAGYFFNEHKTRLVLGSYRFLLILLTAAFIHNVVYFLIYTQGSDLSFFQILFRYGIMTTLYTAVFSLIPIFIYARRMAGPNV